MLPSRVAKVDLNISSVEAARNFTTGLFVKQIVSNNGVKFADFRSVAEIFHSKPSGVVFVAPFV